MWPSGGIKEGSPDRDRGAVVSGTGNQEWPNSLEGEEPPEEELDGDKLGMSFPASHHSRTITRNKNIRRAPRISSTKPQGTVEDTQSGGDKEKVSRGWGEWGSEEESGSGSEEGVEGNCMNGRDSGIHLDDEGRFDDASNPDLRPDRSSSSRLAQSTSDLSLYNSGSDVQLNQSSPDLLNTDSGISVFESLPSGSGGSDGALNRPVRKDDQRHSEYFSEEEEDRENIDKDRVENEEDQNETEQYAKEQEEQHFEEEAVEGHKEDIEEQRREGPCYEEKRREMDDEAEAEEEDDDDNEERKEGEEEETEEEDEETEEEEEDGYDAYSNDSSFQDTSLSPAGLGGQIYKSCTFFDLSLDDDAAFTPSSTRSPKSTFHREAPLYTRSINNEQLNLEEQVRGAGYQAEEKLPWPDLFPRSERQSFGPDSYLDESELLGAKAEQLSEERLSTSYEREAVRPRDFWAEDDELEGSDEEDEVLRYLDDELLALQGQGQREREEMAITNWYNYYFVQSQKGHPSWVTNFSPCPGMRPISDYRFFQPGYLEVITEDDETVSALSEKADESTKSSSGSGQHAHKTMDTAQTTFSEQKEKARENGVQREDSGIVMEPDYKDQNDVILYNSKKVVTNGCDVSTGDEDEGSGSHGNMEELVNGDNKESESDLNDSASERHDTTDTQSESENDPDALLIMGHEQKGSNKPKSQITTVILTTKEYLANGHCRTIIETTRTVRDENGKESASKEIRIETTEPPMPQLKEEDENVETVPKDPHPATTTPTTITPTATHTESTRLDVDDAGDRSDIPKVSLTAATPRQSIDEDDSPHSPSADTQPEVITPVEATPVAAAPTAGDDKQISPPPVQTSPPEPCPEPEIPEVAIRSSLQEAEVVQSVPADAQNKAKTTTKEEVVEEVILSQTRAGAPVEATPPTIAAEPAEVQEEVVVATQITRVRGVAPRKPERTPSVREPVVVVTDPTTEKAVLQNNNSLLPCGNNEFMDANVIADLVYRRFRPNVAKRKLIVLLFPPPYQELGDPIEEPVITPVRVKKETALPPLFNEDVVKADPEEKDEELRNATGEACPGVDDDEQKGRKRNPGFFRRVVRALRRTFNRG